MPDGMTSAKAQHDQVSDYGPRIQRSNGRVEVVDAADPDKPSRTIRRARARCHYDVAWKAGRLSDTEREAADRYAMTQERFQGAREHRNGPSPANSPWMRTPPLTQLQASASLTDAHKAIGNDGAALLVMYVRDNHPVEEVARRRSENPTLCMGRIRATLSRLAEHWGM